MARVRRGCSKKLDRVSNLPSEVTDAILKRLSIGDAVRTSVLSKKWRNNWMYISDLVFDDRSVLGGESHAELTDFVNHVIFLHNGTISRFVMCDYLDYGNSNVHRWIVLLARKSVQELTLMFRNGPPYKVPSSLFNCRNLTKLNLRYCILKLQSRTDGLKKLIHLELQKVTVTDESIASFLMNSPLLKIIKLIQCYGLTCLNISAPSLQDLTIYQCGEDIKFDNAPNLQWAYIRLLGPSSAQNLLPRNNKTHNLEDTLVGLINIQALHFYKNFMEILAVCSIPERLSFSYDFLKYLYLDVNFEDSRQILTALCFLRSWSSLQKLAIKSYSSTELLDLDEEFWETQQHEQEIIFPKLRVVTLTQFNGIQYEFEFIQFLLMKAMVLETLHIEWNSSVHKIQVLEEIIQFPRASPRAKVISTGGKV